MDKVIKSLDIFGMNVWVILFGRLFRFVEILVKCDENLRWVIEDCVNLYFLICLS